MTFSDVQLTADKPTTAFQPLPLNERIYLLDVLRGVALLGVLVMNLPGHALPGQALHQQAFVNPGDANYWAHTITNILFDGKMRALFSLLFGASALLFITRKEEQTGGRIAVADLYLRRTFWLVVFGVFHAHILCNPYELLYFYGVCGFLLFTARHASTRWLLVGVVGCALFLMMVSWWNYTETRTKREKYQLAVALEKVHKPLTDSQKADKNSWEGIIKGMAYDPKKDSVQVATLRGNYADIWTYNHPHAVNAESSTFYSLFWDPLGMMFLGMVLLRWGILTGKARRRTYALLMLAGFGIGLPLGVLAEQQALQQFRDFGQYVDNNPVDWNGNAYHLRRLAMVPGYIGLVGLLYRAGWLTWLWQAVAAVGRMALTSYMAHSVIFLLLFYGVGLDLMGQFPLYQTYFFVVGIWLFQLITSPIWFRFFRFGPLEWLWRSLTYGKQQPMRVH